MSKIENTVLNEIGWSTDYGIPIANEENKQLQQQLNELIANKQIKVEKLDNFKNRLKLLENYEKELERQFKKDNQSILQVQKTQISTAKSTQQSLELEHQRTQQQCNYLQRENDLINSHINDKKLRMVHILSKIDLLKQKTQFQQNQLTEIEEFLKELINNNEILQKYSIADQKQIKDLQIKRDKIREQLEKKKRSIEKLLEQIDNLHLTLQRTDELFSQVNNEHETLIGRWHNALNQLHQRDKEIHQITNEISKFIDLLSDCKERKNDELNLLETQQRSNLEMDQQIRKERYDFVQSLQSFNNLIKNIDQFKIQIINSNSELNKLLSLLDNERGKLKFLDNYEQKLNEKCTNLINNIKQIEQELTEISDKNLNIETAIVHINQRIDNEKKISEKLLKDMQQAQGKRYNYQKIYNDFKNKETSCQMKVENCHNYMVSLHDKFRKVDKEIDYFQGIQYNLEVKISQIQNKLFKLNELDTDNVDNEKSKEKLIDLESTFIDKEKLLSLLQNQKQMLEDDIRIVSIQVEKGNPKVHKFTEDLKNEQLLHEGNRKQLRTIKSTHQQRQVEENLIKLQIDQLNKTINKLNEEIHELQKAQIEMEAIMKEKIIEITTNRDIFMAKKNLMLENQHKKYLEIKELENKINNLTTKYNLVLETIGKNEHGEPLTKNYIKIRNAQEKFELQQEGNRINTELNSLQREIHAMENTLKLMGVSNDQFRKNIGPMNEHNEQILKRMQELRSQLQIELLTLEKKSCNQKREVNHLNNKLTQINEQKNHLQLQINTKKIEITSMEKELLVQEEKIDRTRKTYRKIVQKLNINENQLTRFQYDIEVRIIIMKNDRAVKIVRDLMENIPQIRSKVLELIADLKIELPSSSSRSNSISSLGVLSNYSITSSNSSLMSTKVITF